MPLSKNAITLLQQRYCQSNEKPQDVYKRVANALSLGDSKFEKHLYQSMIDSIFLTNSPCLRNAGQKKSLLHACFILPIEDNIESIFETLKNMALIFHYGGGVGINFSKLRSKDTPLSSGGSSSGVLSFMEVFDSTTNAVKQGGFRRGALMGILNFDHAEIMDFIRSKLKDNLTNFNISVLMTDKVMNAVEKNEKIELINPHNNEIINTVNAKDLFDLVCFSAWNSGDPGMLFYDRINKDNKLFPKIKIVTTNPCGEVPLPEYGACCLGSLNLSKFVKGDKFDMSSFSKHVELATRALLNMNAISWYPLPQITKTMKELNPIGVGVMGFADALIKLGIAYDSQECLNFIDEIAKPYIEITNKLAKDSFYKRIIAPTGSLSILADCSSSIEPIFETTFERHLTVGVLEETRDIYKSKYVRTAHDVSPEWHLKVQAKWQEKLDGACSKTINLPHNASVDDIKNIYINAWKSGVKGVTVFRSGSKGGVLVKKEVKKDALKPKCSDEQCHL